MERHSDVLVIDDHFKKKLGIISFIPAVLFFISALYYFLLLLPLAHGHHELYSGEGITSRHYGTLFAMLAFAATVSMVILIYYIWFLVTIRTLNTPTKMIWMLLLLIVPVSFILIWYFVVRPEPKYVPSNPSIK